jgi:branched-chain amino acid transport system substrate-binding protein
MKRILHWALSAAVIFGLTSSMAVAQSGDVVNIGFTGPLTGGAAAYGADTQRGVQWAIDEINADGGVKVGGKKMTLKLVSLDDQYRPNLSATNAKQLAEQSNTPIIFCPHSGGILAIMGFNERNPRFIVGAYSSEPAILKQNNHTTLMIPPAYSDYFKPFIDVEMKRFGKRLGLAATASAYGKAWTSGFSEAWKAAGGTVLSDDSVDYNTTTDFSGAVTKTLSEKPDVILVGGPSQPTGLVIKAARTQGYKGGFAIMDQAKFEQIETVADIHMLEGAVGIAPFQDSQGPGLKTFDAEYAKRYGSLNRPVNSEVALNYSAMHIFADAINASGSLDPSIIFARVHAAAVHLAPKYEPAVTHGISAAGHLRVDALTAVVKNGKYVTSKVPVTEY